MRIKAARLHHRMQNLTVLLAAAAVLSALAPSDSRAGCVQDYRVLSVKNGQTFTNETCDGSSCKTIKLRSYTCRLGSGPSTSAIRIEFHRFSDGAASALVGHHSVEALDTMIGSSRLVENEVYKVYAQLLSRFGEVASNNPGGDQRAFEINAPGDQWLEASIPLNGMPTLLGTYVGGNQLDYPAFDELSTLRRGSLPSSMKYYYYTEPNSSQRAMMIWRPMKSRDVANYTANARAYNRLVRRIKGKDLMPIDELEAEVPGLLKLFDHLAGGNWPDDFVILSGSVNPRAISTEAGGGCDPAMFSVSLPEFLLDAVLIENISDHPIKIDSLYGRQAAVKSLRALGSQADRMSAAQFDIAAPLAPGEKILVPTKISLVPQCGETADIAACTDDVARWSNRLKQSGQIRANLATQMFRGPEASHAVPLLKTYLYGPELLVDGLAINGERVDLTQRSANFADLVMGGVEKSCPYLLSWDEQTQKWAIRRKVLDKARGKNDEYTDTELFAGFQSRFRLEEREAEIAFIRQVTLVVTLDSGVTLTLEPVAFGHMAAATAYTRLYWGEAAEIRFELPDGLAKEHVVASRFTVTGYYERYPDLLVQVGK